MSSTDFIEVYENALDPTMCQAAIDYFEAASASGFTHSRKREGRSFRDTQDEATFIPIDAVTEELRASGGLCTGMITSMLKHYLGVYVHTYEAPLGDSSLVSPSIKMQKTLPSQGFHVWHYERSPGDPFRELAWILYLNDVEDGGETEFLYQCKRVKPRQGTLVIWPASLTHTHRGNPPLSGVKYVATGWYYHAADYS